jgi:group I intron endonuclease
MNKLNCTDKIVPDKYFGFIYKTIFPNGKIYIGQTTKRSNKKYFGSGKALLKAINKYGECNLKREILIFVNCNSKANKFEEFFIKKFDSTNLSIGYNILPGSASEYSAMQIPEIAAKVSEANKGKIWSDEIKQRISKSVSKTMTKERRELISSQHKGKKMSDESIRLISIATKGENNPMYGKRGENSPMYGRKWINNGFDCKFIDISDGVPQGYSIGRLKLKRYERKKEKFIDCATSLR